MKIAFQAGLPAEWTAAVLIVPLFENETPGEVCPELHDAAPWLLSAPGLADFRGKKDETLLFHGPASRTRAERLDAQIGRASCRERA